MRDIDRLKNADIDGLFDRALKKGTLFVCFGDGRPSKKSCRFYHILPNGLIAIEGEDDEYAPEINKKMSWAKKIELYKREFNRG